MLVQITNAQLRYLEFLVKHQIKEERVFVTQNQAHMRFGRTNVERWLEQGKLKCYHRPNVIEYKMSDLLIAAENQQDYKF